MIKLKSVLVIILSSLVIGAVILSTIIGLSLYLGWKEKEASAAHSEKMAELNVKLYGEHVLVQDVKAKYDKDGLHKGKCFLEGSIKNSGFRTISSLELCVEFLNESGEVMHSERLLPLKTSELPHRTTIAAISYFISGRENPVLPGKSMRFKHVMSDQKNKSVISPIKNKRYATNPNEWAGKLKHEITKIRF
jgi:hypothetical protein